nr:MAG TPA: hypothetical protein [Caudoviricetes sp.]
MAILYGTMCGDELIIQDVGSNPTRSTNSISFLIDVF